MSDSSKGDDDFSLKDTEEFARNMARLTEESGKAMAAAANPKEVIGPASIFADESNIALKTLGHVAEKFLSNPEKAAKAQNELWQNYFTLWTGTLKRMNDGEQPHVADPEPGDRRFADQEWADNPMFDFIKQAYLLTSRWAENAIDQTDDLDEHTRHKAHFYLKQIANAMSPSNFVMTNPELLRETIDSHGENLVRGMHLLAEDIEAGKGELKLRQTDAGDFEVGKNMALTPGKVIYQNELMQLIQYQPATEKVLKRPLLIVPPWINKFYILDLNPEKSFIRWAVEQGHTVFVISWVNPDERQSRKSFAEYMMEGPLTALDVIKSVTDSKKVNAIGYCVGGTLLAVTLGWMAARNDKRIASATFFTTQVDFTHAGDLKVFVDEEQISALENDMEKRGYLEGRRMATAFNMLRSNDLIWPYMVNNYVRGKAPAPFDLLFWNSDATRMPAANHSFYLRNCYLENNLSQGKMEVGGVKIDLKKSDTPIYNMAAREDHIAPAKSVFVGCSSFGGDVTYLLAGSGHIAGVINPPAKKKYQYWTGGEAVGEYEDWVKTAEEHPGSWWPHWQAWIESYDDKKVDAREVGNKDYPPIEDAPGSYVKVQS